MLDNNLSPEQAAAMKRVYIDLRSQTESPEAEARISEIRHVYGSIFYQHLAACCAYHTITKLEVTFNLPPRSGKVLLAFIANIIMHHQKDKEHVYS